MNFPEIVFSGHVAAKPQLTALPESPQGPTVVARMRVAVTPRRRTRGSEEWVDGETLWFNVSTWRSTAANCVASLNQGDRVLVRGRLSQRSWTDSEGVERPSFDVDAEAVALDLARHPAMSLRKTPEQRPPAADDDAQWASTGQVDGETGAATLTPVEPEPEPAPA